MGRMRRALWAVMQAIALLTIVLVGVGLYNAIQYNVVQRVDANASLNRPAQAAVKTETKDVNQFNILVLGDSIAKGTGDENGKGLGSNLAELLKGNTSREIVVQNLGVDGLKVRELLLDVKSGRLDGKLRNADMVLISIGGNDLREIRTLQGAEKEQRFKETQTRYVAEFREIKEKLRGLNQSALLVVPGLYNPYDEMLDGGRLVTEWNYNTQRIVEEDGRMLFVPTQSLFKFNLKRFIAPDNLHPNSSGYYQIASMVSKAVEGIL